MSCFGSRGGEQKELSDQQKWDYINLNDFKTSNCITVFSYIWLWFLVVVAIAVYAADTFTAVKLLGFNEWSSEVKPSIPFAVSKWIFAVCILLSWTILIFEWIRALRVMARGSVADDYLDELAVKLQSMRFGTGWRRFLVFAELTKSKKKVTWIALFVYFQRKSAIRLLLADGPRQVVNALTIYSVAKVKLVPAGSNAASQGRSAVAQFFVNLKILADANHTQTVILSSMMFTLVIWVVSMLLLFLALTLYLFFLWHHIHNETLNGFCRRKVETRLERIVKAKTEKIWAKQQAKRAKEDAKMGKSSDDDIPQRIQRQPTLPTLVESPPKDSELSRSDSMATLPLYTSKPGTPLDVDPPPLLRQPTLPDFGPSSRPSPPARSFTSLTSSSAISNMSYNSRTSLLGDASPIGYSDPPSLYRTGTSRSYGAPAPAPSPSPLPSLPLPRSTPTPQSPYVAYSPSATPKPTAPGPRRSQTTSPPSPYEPPQSYEMAPLPNDAYFPQQSRSPAPRGTAFGPPVDRRAGPRSQTPGVRNFAYPRPMRSVTAPLPGGGMEQRGPGFGMGGRSFTGDGAGWV